MTVSLDEKQGSLVVYTTATGSAIAFLTATVVNVALPSLASELGADTAQQQWVVNAYTLMLASLILLGGALGDRFGRVKLYRLGITGFAVASLACAVAPTIEALIGARFALGIAGAVVTPGSLAIIEASITRDDRGRAIGRWTGLTSIAAAVGPLLGGLLIELSWRWIFVINLPVAAVVLILSRGMPETSDPEAKGTPLDWAGALLTAVALGGISFVLIHSTAGDWGWWQMGTIAIAFAAATGLGFVESRHEHPMIPFDLFANRAFAASNALTFFVYGGLGINFFLLSIHLQVTVGFSPLMAGAALLPITVILLILSPTIGDLAQRHGPRWFLTFGPAAMAAGMLLFMGIDSDSAFLMDIFPGTLIFGAGLALAVAPVTATALNAVPDERSGAASGANNAAARAGQLLTVASIPPAVGLTGAALNQAEALEAAFPAAMGIAAALISGGGLVAALFLRQSDLGDEES